MREYVVYREGWNETNQNRARGVPEKMAVARVFANNPEEACRNAAQIVALSANQRLTAELAEVIDAREASLNVSPRSAPDAEGG